MTQLNELSSDLLISISDEEAAVVQGGFLALIDGIVGTIRRRRERCNNRPAPKPSAGRTPGPQEGPHQF